MAHLLATRVQEKTDSGDDLVRLTEQSGTGFEQIHLDMGYFSVPNDAAILKQFTPLYITSHGAKPQYMWASREFESLRNMSTFPAYIMSGFGLLDAFVHAYATNSTLVLHPLDIVLSVCYGYGHEQRKLIPQNNEELIKPMQIILKHEFTRANLLLSMTAKMVRRVETFPLGKLYALLNSEMNSPDPLIIRLVLGILSYLSATSETTKLTVDHFKYLFDLYKNSRVGQLYESSVQTWGGLLDVRHDPSAPTAWRKVEHKEAAPKKPENKFKLAKASGLLDDEVPSSISTASSGQPREVGRSSGSSQGQRTSKPVGEVWTAKSAALETATGASATKAESAGGVLGRTNDTNIRRTSLLEFDDDINDEDTKKKRNSLNAQTEGSVHHAIEKPNFEVVSIYSNDLIMDESVVKMPGAPGANNSNLVEEQDAAEWFLKPRLPSRLYKFKKETSIHSVLFKGSQKAWLELPEMLHELGQFFMLDSALLSKITKVGQKIQRTRLNAGREHRKWWQKALFKDGTPESLPDGDVMINGWLALLLGERVISESCPMTINKLCDLKPGVKLPMLLVRQPATSSEDTDDDVLDSESGLMLTRLRYFDDYREKFINTSSNAREVPIGLFMPWRSCDTLIRTKRLWRQVGGDTPSVTRNSGSRTATNLSNVEALRPQFGSISDREQGVQDEEVAVKLWTPRSQASAHSRSGTCFCCGGRAKRQVKTATEPLYNMSCLISGLGGFCLNESGDTPTHRMCVRPLCFVEIAHEK